MCRVMLLAMSAGGAGLTLVQASHVFLLEPTIDPAIEQQAVARVHRIGQTKPVVCTRLLVSESVEEAVLEVCQRACCITQATHQEGCFPVRLLRQRYVPQKRGA